MKYAGTKQELAVGSLLDLEFETNTFVISYDHVLALSVMEAYHQYYIMFVNILKIIGISTYTNKFTIS